MYVPETSVLMGDGEKLCGVGLSCTFPIHMNKKKNFHTLK